MFNAYRVIVRRVLDGGGGPDAIVRWVRAEACQLATAGHQQRLPKDRLIELLSDRLAGLVANRQGTMDTRLEETFQAFGAEV